MQLCLNKMELATSSVWHGNVNCLQVLEPSKKLSQTGHALISRNDFWQSRHAASWCHKRLCVWWKRKNANDLKKTFMQKFRRSGSHTGALFTMRQMQKSGRLWGYLTAFQTSKRDTCTASSRPHNLLLFCICLIVRKVLVWEPEHLIFFIRCFLFLGRHYFFSSCLLLTRWDSVKPWISVCAWPKRALIPIADFLACGA